MKQIVNIFKKDVQHHWPEIALSLLIVALYVWHEPSLWRYREYLHDDRLQHFLTPAVNIGAVLSWFLLTVRVTQGESLVGDRQFWITRPYEWKKLLAAKILFLLVFVYVPALIGGIILLHMAGFSSPLSYLPQFLTMDITGAIPFMLLFAMSFAVVTPNLLQFILGLLCLGAFVGAAAAVFSYVPSGSFSSGTDTLQESMMVLACIVTVIWQFARRKTNKSRLLMAGTALSIFLLAMATPYETFVAREYPSTDSAKLPMQVAFDTVKPLAPTIEPDDKDEVEVKFPLNISGIAPNTTVSIHGEMLKITAPDGRRWNSGWGSESGRHYNQADLSSGRNKLEVSFKIKKKFFESVQSVPVKGDIYLALVTSQDRESHRFIVQAGDFRVPELGICSIIQESSGNTLRCRAAFKTQSGRATIHSSEITCPALPRNPIKPGLVADDWYGGGEADFISPVETVDLFFWGWDDDTTGSSSGPNLCPGTPILLTREEVLQRASTKIEIKGIHLADYRASNSFTFGIVRSR